MCMFYACCCLKFWRVKHSHIEYDRMHHFCSLSRLYSDIHWTGLCFIRQTNKWHNKILTFQIKDQKCENYDKRRPYIYWTNMFAKWHRNPSNIYFWTMVKLPVAADPRRLLLQSRCSYRTLFETHQAENSWKFDLISFPNSLSICIKEFSPTVLYLSHQCQKCIHTIVLKSLFRT